MGFPGRRVYQWSARHGWKANIPPGRDTYLTVRFADVVGVKLWRRLELLEAALQRVVAADLWTAANLDDVAVRDAEKRAVWDVEKCQRDGP